VKVLSVVAIPSGRRKGSYSERQFAEQRDYFGLLAADPAGLRQEMLTAHLFGQLLSLRASAAFLASAPMRRLAHAVVLKAQRAIWRLWGGRSPHSWRRLLRSKGATIDKMRTTRGLDPK
jgi:hypothetical protein